MQPRVPFSNAANTNSNQRVAYRNVDILHEKNVQDSKVVVRSSRMLAAKTLIKKGELYFAPSNTDSFPGLFIRHCTASV